MPLTHRREVTIKSVSNNSCLDAGDSVLDRTHQNMVSMRECLGLRGYCSLNRGLGLRGIANFLVFKHIHDNCIVRTCFPQGNCNSSRESLLQRMRSYHSYYLAPIEITSAWQLYVNFSCRFSTKWKLEFIVLILYLIKSIIKVSWQTKPWREHTCRGAIVYSLWRHWGRTANNYWLQILNIILISEVRTNSLQSERKFTAASKTTAKSTDGTGQVGVCRLYFGCFLRHFNFCL